MKSCLNGYCRGLVSQCVHGFSSHLSTCQHGLLFVLFQNLKRTKQRLTRGRRQGYYQSQRLIMSRQTMVDGFAAALLQMVDFKIL